MKLKVERRFFGAGYTVGRLYIDGEYFCDTLEDKYRDLSKEAKIHGETCIPFGTYKVVVNHSPRFKRNLPRLLDVPHFDGILIHRGNTPEDTSGCILVGENKAKGRVVNSRMWEERLLEKLEGEDDITIEIV